MLPLLKRRSLSLLPVLGLACLLGACAGPMPKPDPQQAWIGLQEETQDSVLAEKVDGKPINDGRYFEVRPGEHDLAMMIFHQQTNDEQQTCRVDLDYRRFKAGEHYRLVESSLGLDLRVSLENPRGRTLAEAKNFDCLPG